VSGWPTLTLYSKPGCHLCEDLAALLDDLQPEWGFAVRTVDITRDPTLFARYRHEIPVLMCGTQEIARGRVDARDLLNRLAAFTSR
jgi:glutaredoxin